MSDNPKIQFRDLVEREKKARQALQAQRQKLEKRRARHTKLPDAEQRELERLEAVLTRLEAAKSTEVTDPLYVAARDLFNINHGLVDAQIGNFTTDENNQSPPPGVLQPLDGEDLAFPDVVRISLVLGLLVADGIEPPRIIHAPKHPTGDAELVVDPEDPRYANFSRAFFAAFGEAQAGNALAVKVLSLLEEEGDPSGSRRIAGEVSTLEFAEVLRCLRKKGTKASEGQLRRRVNECLDRIQEVGIDRPLSVASVVVPDLNAVADYEIQSENVKLMGAVICSAMFEELKVYRVVDKLVELAQNGMLPIGRGTAGETLYRYWREAPNRMSEAERRSFYALTIGVPGGDANGMVNREFNDLWLRFVSSVSSLVRQMTANNLLVAKIPAGINQQQVRKAARDLAMNLSMHGYGMAVFHAIELRDLIQLVIDLLGDHEIMAAYGARDMWQVIDQVATLELGGARNAARYRTLASSGAIITAWLANNVPRYNRATSEPIINTDDVTSLEPSTAGTEATTKPTDYDLVNACELWLADTATSEDRVEELAQPRESPVATSRPVQIPAVARDLLEQAGVGVPGLGLGNGYRR